MATPFTITSATFGIGTDGAETEYCAEEFSFNEATEVLTFDCLSGTNPITLPGTQTFSGTARLAYEATGMDQLWGASANLEIVITKSTGGTITLEGSVQVSSVDSTFSRGSFVVADISWTANGAMTEVISA